jgi:hypothetical protein
MPKDGLVLDLDAGNPNSYLSGTTWTDLSGKGNNVTLNNGPTYSTANGGTINFDGTDDSGYKNAPSGMNFSSTNAMSAEAWIKYSPNDYDFWFTGNNSGIKYRFGTNSSRYFYWDMGQHADRSYNGYQVPQNEWVHVVFTGGIESGTIVTRIYANGVLITTGNEGISSLPDVGEIWVGHGEGQGTHPFNGDIALLKIYNRVLTPQEISNSYTIQSPRYRVQLPRTVTDSLALDVDFGNTTSYPREGTTVYDRSGNGNNGTLTNGPIYEFVNGGVIGFDGVDDYVTFGNPSSMSNAQVTVTFWYNPTTLMNSTHNGIMNGRTPGGRFCLFWINGTTLSTQYRDDSGLSAAQGGVWTRSNAPVAVSANKWYFIQITGNESTNEWRVGVDLNVSTSSFSSQYVEPDATNWLLGRRAGTAYDHSKIANVQVYDRILTPSEVLENYKSTRSRFGNDGIVTSNLVFNVDAGNVNSFDNSGTTWNDLSGNGYNGTLTNGPTFNPYNGGNIEFDGTNDYVGFGSQFLIPGVIQDGTISNLTIEAWVKWDQFSAGGAYDEIISWWKGGSQTYSDGFLGTSVIGGGSPTKPVIRFGDGWANTGVTFTAATDVGKWFHVVAVKTTSNAYVYINGELRATKGSALSWGFNGYGTIGKHSSGGSEYIDGEIAIVRLYDTNLSSTQILQNYNADRNRFGLD